MPTINYTYDEQIPAWLCAGILRLALRCSPFKFKRMVWVHFQYRKTQPDVHAWAITPRPPHRRKSRYVYQVLHPPRTNAGHFENYRVQVRWWLAWRVSALAHELAHINDAQRGLRFNRHSVPHNQRIQEIRAEESEQIAIVKMFTTTRHRHGFDRLVERVATTRDKNWRKP